MRISSRLCGILPFLGLLICQITLGAGGVDLHVHLFMKEGLGPLFQGHFYEELRAKDWTARFESQANAKTLKESGLSIVVASLYAHPWLSGNQRDSIRAQIKLAQKFVLANPNWIIAKSPSEAREALAQGKQILILSLEGAAGVLETEHDLKEFVDEAGIRIVTFFHLTDDHLGGAALLDGLRGLASPSAFFRSYFANHRGDLGELVNANGISQKGLSLLDRLLDRGVWIDLAHATDSAWRTVVPVLRSRDQPLLVSHTALRRLRPMERAVSDIQVRDIARSGGMIGLMPSEEMLRPRPEGVRCPPKDLFSEQFNELTQNLGAGSVVLGTDFNGGIRHLSPDSPECQNKVFGMTGFWNLGQTQDFLKSILRHPNLRQSFTPLRMTDRFLECWGRILPR